MKTDKSCFAPVPIHFHTVEITTWAIITRRVKKFASSPLTFQQTKLFQGYWAKLWAATFVSSAALYCFCFFFLQNYSLLFQRIFFLLETIVKSNLYLKERNHCLLVLESPTRHPALRWKHQKPEKRCKCHNSHSRLYHCVIICRIPLTIRFLLCNKHTVTVLPKNTSILWHKNSEIV